MTAFGLLKIGDRFIVFNCARLFEKVSATTARDVATGEVITFNTRVSVLKKGWENEKA